MLPRSVVEASCARCDGEAQAGLPDRAAELRTRRAATWEKGRIMRHIVKGNIVEEALK